MEGASRIPIFLLTGFLGSGKTTLLNRLMAARPRSRGKLAIVVNEFGAVGIDGDLLPADMTRQVELPGGCICCVLNEDLDRTLLELLDSAPDVEMVVIETTGIAEPLPISWSLAREPLSERFRLAAVITVVDVTLFEQSRALSPAVDAQVEYADILILGKTDLLESGQTPAEVRASVRSLNESALEVSGTAAEVTATLWRAIADPSGAQRSSGAVEKALGQTDGGPGDHRRRDFAHDFDTIWLPIENIIDFEELSDQLEALPGNYVRIKGIAQVVDESTGSATPHWIAFHRVGTRVSSEPVTGPTERRLVALGPGIERSRLAACLDASVVRCKR